jgi:hypothetical protein
MWWLGGVGEGLVLWAGYWVFRGRLGGFAAAVPGVFQQLVEGLWAGYLVDGFCSKPLLMSN